MLVIWIHLMLLNSRTRRGMIPLDSKLLSRVQSLRNAVAHGSSLANQQLQWPDVFSMLTDMRAPNARFEAGDGQDALTMREEMSAEHA